MFESSPWIVEPRHNLIQRLSEARAVDYGHALSKRIVNRIVNVFT